MPQLKEPSEPKAKKGVRVPIMGYPDIPEDRADLVTGLAGASLNPMGMAGKGWTPGGDLLESGSLYGLDRARAATNNALKTLGGPQDSASIGGKGLLEFIDHIMRDPGAIKKLFGQ